MTVVLVLTLTACLSPPEYTADSACAQYDAEVEGAPCLYPCPWQDGPEAAQCDPALVHECAEAVRASCLTETPVECAEVCR